MAAYGRNGWIFHMQNEETQLKDIRSLLPGPLLNRNTSAENRLAIMANSMTITTMRIRKLRKPNRRQCSP